MVSLRSQWPCLARLCKARGSPKIKFICRVGNNVCHFRPDQESGSFSIHYFMDLCVKHDDGICEN